MEFLQWATTLENGTNKVVWDYYTTDENDDIGLIVDTDWNPITDWWNITILPETPPKTLTYHWEYSDWWACFGTPTLWERWVCNGTTQSRDCSENIWLQTRETTSCKDNHNEIVENSYCSEISQTLSQSCSANLCWTAKYKTSKSCTIALKWPEPSLGWWVLILEDERYRYPSCDTYSRIITTWSASGIVVSACNVWATKAWAHMSCTSSINGSKSIGSNTNCSTDKIWQHFQWSRNMWFDTETAPELWDNTLWKFQTSDIIWNWDDTWNDMLSADWPCEIWWHIPTHEEWQKITGLIGEWIRLRNDLLMPFVGLRNYSSSVFDNVDFSGSYWSSTADGTTNSVWCLDIGSGYVWPNNRALRHRGFSVRCIKDFWG